MNAVTKELIDANCPEDKDIERWCEIADAVEDTELFKGLNIGFWQLILESVNTTDALHNTNALRWIIKKTIATALTDGIEIGRRIPKSHKLQELYDRS